MGSDSKDLAYQLILQSRRSGEGIIAAARLVLCGVLFLMVVFVLFYGIMSKGASNERSIGGKEILTSLGTLKSQADSVTGLVIKQVEECNKIEKNTSELNSILENNKEIIEKLRNLVKQI